MRPHPAIAMHTPIERESARQPAAGKQTTNHPQPTTTDIRQNPTKPGA
ncbi:hypothetical protein GCM10011612_14160 [Actinomyces gaoshouyii]|uniref:Uncharacterized protein n=1 Tax=Actinomyces gaoshouyii TaxID=1960083 RepID=A0A8H9HBN5_9ACTO|nr:hypothetical protein GCM10011612_14160 [Actinomyces gaoshouyii]